jgi:hypothetical protein
MPSGLTTILASPQAAPLLLLSIVTVLAVWFAVSQMSSRAKADARAEAAIDGLDEERKKRIAMEDALRKELRDLRDEVAKLRQAMT